MSVGSVTARSADVRERPLLRLREGLPDEPAEWSELAVASGNVFATPEWALTWWEHFGGRRRALSATASNPDGRPRALAVLCVAGRRPARVARFVGYGLADELGPACAPAHATEVAPALRAVVNDLDLADVFVGDHLRTDLGWETSIGSRVVTRTPSPLIRFADRDWSSFLAGRSPSLRRQVRRLERLLGDTRASLRMTADPDRLDADLETFFMLHRRRFGRRSGFLADRRSEQFHRAFAKLAFSRGWLRLWILELDEQPQAAWYGFRFAGSDCFYQSGRSSTAPSGAGVLLLAWTIRCALEDGMREYRFLRGGESYKYRWADEDVALHTVAVARSRLAKRAVALASSPELERDRRRSLPGLAGLAARHLLLGR